MLVCILKERRQQCVSRRPERPAAIADRERSLLLCFTTLSLSFTFSLFLSLGRSLNFAFLSYSPSMYFPATLPFVPSDMVDCCHDVQLSVGMSVMHNSFKIYICNYITALMGQILHPRCCRAEILDFKDS